MRAAIVRRVYAVHHSVRIAGATG